MTTLTVGEPVAPIAEPVADVEKQNEKRLWLLRFLDWYRAAVRKPTTEKEKAEWQKTSF